MFLAGGPTLPRFLAGDPTLPQPLRMCDAPSSGVSSLEPSPSPPPLESLAPAWARSQHPMCPLLPAPLLQVVLEDLNQVCKVLQVGDKAPNGVSQVPEGREGLAALTGCGLEGLGLGDLGMLVVSRHAGAAGPLGARGA